MSLKKINYIGLTNSALLSVLKEILLTVSKDGLYKKQHLYITFSTKHPGVRISEFLDESFDEEMTIVLEHEFWDFIVDNYGFSISLEFEHGAETIYIPFSSVITILDPSEDFSLDFFPDFSDLQRPSPQNNKPENVDNNNVIILDIFRKGK